MLDGFGVTSEPNGIRNAFWVFVRIFFSARYQCETSNDPWCSKSSLPHKPFKWAQAAATCKPMKLWKWKRLPFSKHLRLGQCVGIEKRFFCFHFETSNAQLEYVWINKRNECNSHEISNVPVLSTCLHGRDLCFCLVKSRNLFPSKWSRYAYADLFRFSRYKKDIDFVTQKIMSSGLDKLGKTNKYARAFSLNYVFSVIQFR